MADLTDLEMMTCGECGIVFAAPKAFFDERRKGTPGASRGWHCPNGHSRVFRETENDKLRRERDRLAQENARLAEERLAADRKAAAEQRKRERIEKRIGAGVCPCCNRTVAQLAKHMQSKHPDVPFVSVPKVDPRQIVPRKRVRA